MYRLIRILCQVWKVTVISLHLQSKHQRFGYVTYLHPARWSRQIFVRENRNGNGKRHKGFFLNLALICPSTWSAAFFSCWLVEATANHRTGSYAYRTNATLAGLSGVIRAFCFGWLRFQLRIGAPRTKSPCLLISPESSDTYSLSACMW